MAKNIPAALAAHYNTGATSLAYGFKITREDGQIFAYTSHDQDVTISGTLYDASQGLSITQIVTTSGANVGNMELTTLHDGTVFTNADILGGLWRGAKFVIFRYNWKSPSDGVDYLLAGVLGEIEIRRETLTIELRDMRQFLQQPIGSVSSKTCRYRLGSTSRSDGGLCLKDLTAFTVTGTLTSVTSNLIFRDNTRAEAADYFGEGIITWTSGNNVGLSAKIRAYGVDGTFTLSLPMYQTVQVGDTYIAVAGCRKRLTDDCLGKFNNVLNFGGEPHRPVVDDLTQTPTPDV